MGAGHPLDPGHPPHECELCIMEGLMKALATHMLKSDDDDHGATKH